MKKLFLLLLLISCFQKNAFAQVSFTFDSISAPPYICQAHTFDVEVFGMVADGSTQAGNQSFLVRNDTVFAQFEFVSGPGPAMPYRLYRKINVPAPGIGRYKIVAQGIYNGQTLQTLTSQITVCADISGTKEITAKNSEVKLAPNPAGQYLQIELPANSEAFLVATVLNSQGKTCLTQTLAKGKVIRLNIMALPAGIYALQLRTGKELIMKRFVKH